LIQYEKDVTISAGDRSVSMPSDFHHDLLACYDPERKNYPTIRSNTRVLYRDYNAAESVSEVSEVALEGETLFIYRKAAKDITLTVSYYGKPTTLADDNDEPTGLPEHLQNDLLVSGTLIEFLPESSDDIQVKEARKDYHIQRHLIARKRLKEFYINAPKQQNQIIRLQRDY